MLNFIDGIRSQMETDTLWPGVSIPKAWVLSLTSRDFTEKKKIMNVKYPDYKQTLKLLSLLPSPYA